MRATSLLFVMGIILLLGCIQSPQTTIPTPTPTAAEDSTVCIGEKCIQVRLAQTETEKQRGLMGVTSLTNEEGMLFIWEEEGNYPFWMKDTLIPLDIIWIQADGTIIDIATLQPCETDPCPTHFPIGNATYVLETNAGLMQQWNVTSGDQAVIRLAATP